jgi:chromosome segregation protein
MVGLKILVGTSLWHDAIENMVHIKQVELSHFKSFGGTTAVPILPGFTVVSGPNGSGKSNILDALLFCLGLSSSKGMRAERLPDLVNHNNGQRGNREALVNVTLDLSEEGSAEPIDWTVTRRLRVNAQGGYTSNYMINGEACTLTELHERLNELRIYPEGYNVVLQGDVTSIISMHSRERREIIDELAGVASFDRKIEKTKSTLLEVREKTDRCQIVMAELVAQRERLSQDRLKAEKYQKLREEMQTASKEAAILLWRSNLQKQKELQETIQRGEQQREQIQANGRQIATEILAAAVTLEELNRQVKAMGEEQLVAAQGLLAEHQAEKRRLTQQQQELLANQQANQQEQQLTTERLAKQQQELAQFQTELERIEQQELGELAKLRDAVRNQLEITKEKASSIAASSSAWVEQQTRLNKQIEALLEASAKQQTSRASLTERESQLHSRIATYQQTLGELATQLTAKQQEQPSAHPSSGTDELAEIESRLQALEKNLRTQNETQARLQQEQRDKERQLDRLEAQALAEQEVKGSLATKVIQDAKLKGVRGLVANLGVVDSRYQLALSIAAGARMSNLVVTDDRVAAAAIEILKQKRGGRATFLPLNKISGSRLMENSALMNAQGFIDYAVNLVESDGDYSQIFSYVFGSTVVFSDLEKARAFLGKQRIVTLAGELLEASGAMTGGNINHKATLQFGTADSAESSEIAGIRKRLEAIAEILRLGQESIERDSLAIRQFSEQLYETKQRQSLNQLTGEQLAKEIAQLTQQQTQLQAQLATAQAELAQTVQALQAVGGSETETELAALRQELAELENAGIHDEWQVLQGQIRDRELELQERERAMATATGQLTEVQQNQILGRERVAELGRRHQEAAERADVMKVQQVTLGKELTAIEAAILAVQQTMAELENHLGAEKAKRDAAETALRQLQTRQQEGQWELEKLTESQAQRQQSLLEMMETLTAQRAELPEDLEIPADAPPVDPEVLTALQDRIRSLQRRMEAMEPVNMLALEAYEEANNRLEELNQKLDTLSGESNELLLRIENFTTLRLAAFKEAFDVVNENFQTIFAELSDGDGYLQLDNALDPFSGGLNLVAHPKGKPVQRLTSMSGGEKSLTALSFIFALQRYRPSPFYAFDEVDMFLDGANVERLARMIRKQAGQAQFIVVSLRRPMIESADRTIGVTQARGAYTQVLGIDLKSPV